jgi:hypothetical protein
MVMLEFRFASAELKMIVPVTENVIVSEALALPATHSPATAPEATLLLAAMIASRNVHKPSLALAASDKLLTVMAATSGLIPPLSAANTVAGACLLT